MLSFSEHQRCSVLAKKSCPLLSFQWCIHARCVPDGTKPSPPINGNWGSWSEYSECSKNCGIGLQWKTRKCDDPL